MKRFFFHLVILCAPAMSFAGSKGYTAVFFDVGNSGFFEQPPYTLFRDGEFQPHRRATECWQNQATGGERIAWLIRKKLPEGLSTELAQGILNGEPNAMASVQRILKKTKSPDSHDHVDGIYIIDARNEAIAIIALGVRGPLGPRNPSKKISIPWNKADPGQGAADFDLALCSVSKPLGYGFAP